MRYIQLRGILVISFIVLSTSAFSQIVTEEISVQANEGKTLIQDEVEIVGNLDINNSLDVSGNLDVGQTLKATYMEVRKDATTWGDTENATNHHLELFSNNTGVGHDYIGLMFHHGSQYWRMIRTNRDGFHFTNASNFSYNRIYASAFNQISDNVFKKNVATISDPLTLISGLRGVKFDWIEDDTPSIGFIAQEVMEVLPELVQGTEGGLSVEYANIVAVAVEAIKELNAKVEALEAELAALKGE